jgi:hypothetical protein
VTQAAAKLETAAAGVKERAARRELAQAEVKVAEARLLAARADVQRTEALLQFAQLRAPFDGVVTRRAVDVGAFVGQPGGKGTALFEVVRFDRVRIVVQVPEADALLVRQGTRAVIRVRGLAGRAFEGKVTRTAPTLDPQSRTLRAEIDLPNPKEELRPGMFATVALTVETEKGKEDPTRPAERKEDLPALRKAQLEAASKAYEEARRAASQTRRVGDLLLPLARPEEVYSWSVRWLNAQRDLSDKKEEQIAALEAHLQRMKELQQDVTRMQKAGLLTSLEVPAAEFRRAEAELWLAQAKAR